jgi:ribosomal-protein-alanine N-acetyltransferase
VEAPSRRRGIGTRLLREALDFLRDSGAEEITLEVQAGNEAAASLYRKFGFRHKEWLPDYYGPGRPGIRMVLGPGGEKPPGEEPRMEEGVHRPGENPR